MNKKYIEVEKLIINAYIELLKTDPYHEITVTQVTNVAHVSRKTYYSHFSSNQEILNKILEEKGKEFMVHCDTANRIINKQEVDYNDMYDAYKRFFMFWNNKENKMFLRIMIKQQLLQQFSDSYIPYKDFECVQFDLKRFEKGTLIYEYYPPIANAMLYKTLESWVKRGFKESMDDLAKIMMDVCEIISKYKN